MPQLFTSIEVSTHTPLQLVVPDGQQSPLRHTIPAPQGVWSGAGEAVQLPLVGLHLFGLHGSVDMGHFELESMQAPPTQANVWLHLSIAAHEVPQPPQLFGSV